MLGQSTSCAIWTRGYAHMPSPNPVARKRIPSETRVTWIVISDQGWATTLTTLPSWSRKKNLCTPQSSSVSG